jgi:acyl transferase domain-containing protein
MYVSHIIIETQGLFKIVGAGIAGLLKVLLAMRHKTIPPNQHLHNLNPKVEPFYKHLRIPTEAQRWPSVPPLHPLRASINGFGSGGTNCHAIMESYIPELHDHGPWGRQESLIGVHTSVLPDIDLVTTPTLFSASSETALVALLEKYAQCLENADIPIQRIAMTLNSYRSTLPVKVAFAGTSRTDILEEIKKQLSKANGNPGTEIGTRSSFMEFDQSRRPRIMGVFTGQGAQWPGMGQSLMAHCALFRETFEVMEKSLAELPDPPAWSLKEELMASPARSRLNEAELSLPLCAAVQVGLVRVLAKAGISFYLVVGHSGGEIGAAYAAAMISATDAVRIAYYRGIVCKLAIGDDGRRGAMIAVGFGFDEGIKFCSSNKMKGRLTVAASNSPKSVTLSGDEDAVIEAKEILDKEGLFNRLLKVDTAYHSPHMYHCAEPYLAALEKCDIGVGKAIESTAWYSSVYEDNRKITPERDAKMRTIYWKDNLIQRVLFSQAVERALDDERGVPDLILEVGPHPALRGPTLETIRTKLGSEIPYSGILDRKADDIAALNNALGFVWMKLGSDFLNFRDYASAFNESDIRIDATPLPDLPSYPWDHKHVLWRESRLNKQLRSRADRPHELLGNRTPDDTDYEPRWRNFFKLEEMPWIRNHCIQNQVVLPAATYCVMALEAARTISKGKQVHSIELSNIAILRPVVLNEASEGTETLLSLRSDLDSTKGKVNSIHASFSLSAGTMEDGHMRTVATGEIQVFLANEENDFSNLLPIRSSNPPSELIPVDINQFYESLGEIGLNYSGAFRGMVSAERRMDMASALITLDEEVGRSIPVHPTWLDTCFQTFLAAFAAPGDGSLWTSFMPTSIGRMRFAPVSSLDPDAPGSVIADAHVTKFVPGFRATLPTISGDLSIHNSATGQLEVCVEDFTMSTFLPATKKDDKLLYLKSIWQQDILSGATFESEQPSASQHELQLIDACEKAIQYYLSKFAVDKSIDEIAEKSPGLAGLIEEAAASDTSRPTRSELVSILEQFGQHIDMVLVRMIGEGLLGTSQGFVPDNSQIPASLDDLTTRWHNGGLGFAQIDKHIVSAATQISLQHSQLKILQIGPSSNSLVRAVCQNLGHTLASYIIVDESAHAIEAMKGDLNPDGLKVNFEQFNIEDGLSSATEFVATGSFDMIIAHKSFKKQSAALKMIRRLLRPGGFLLMMAAMGQKLRFPFFLSAAPSRTNEDDGSIVSKFTNTTREETHKALLDSGFSGIDSIAFDSVYEKHTFSLVVSQALDQEISFLRSPLSAPTPFNTSGTLLVLGGISPDRANLIHTIQARLSGVWTGEIINIKSLAELTCEKADSAEAVLSLTELDHSLLEQLKSATFKGLQLLLERSKIILWVTLNTRSGNCFQNGTVGLGRSLQSENPHKVLQFLDLDTLEGSESLIAGGLLRLLGGALMQNEDSSKSHLWNIEPEIAVEKGKFLIQRILPDSKRNDRLNSLRRRVQTQVLAEFQPVTVARYLHTSGEIEYTAEEALNHPPNLVESSSDNDQVNLKVEYCSMEPVLPNYNGENLFCCVGNTQEGLRFLALSVSNSSIVTVPRRWTVRLDDLELESADILPLFISILGEITSRVVEEATLSGYTTLLYKPATNLAASIARHHGRTDKDVKFLDDRSHSTIHTPPSCRINIRPQCSRRELKSIIPAKTKLLIHQGRRADARNFAALQQALPKNSMIVSFDELNASAFEPRQILCEALHDVKSLTSTLNATVDDTSVVKVSVLSTEEVSRHEEATVVDWTGNQMITVTQKPISLGHLLSAHKTYILVGLSGQIGQSVCRWMVGNGARHIVVASR